MRCIVGVFSTKTMEFWQFPGFQYLSFHYQVREQVRFEVPCSGERRGHRELVRAMQQLGLGRLQNLVQNRRGGGRHVRGHCQATQQRLKQVRNFHLRHSTTVQFRRCCCEIQQMALLHSTAELHFICSTRLLAETTPSVGFQNTIFVWREAKRHWCYSYDDSFYSVGRRCKS